MGNGFLDTLSQFVPDVLKGTSPAEQRINQGFQQHGTLGGLINAAGQLPAVGGDTANELADYTPVGPLRQAAQGLMTPQVGVGAAIAGLVGLGAAGALAGYHRYRADLPVVDRNEYGMVRFPGVGEGPLMAPPTPEVPVYATPEYRPQPDVLRARSHAEVAAAINDFKPATATKNLANQAALAGYSQALGDTLVRSVPLHAEQLGNYSTPQEASLAASAWELARMDAAVKQNLLIGGAKPYADLYRRLITDPTNVTPADRQLLANFQVDLANKLQSLATPDLYMPPPLKWAGFDHGPDGVTLHATYDEKLLPTPVTDNEWQSRINNLNYGDVLPLMVHNIMTAPMDPKYVGWYREANQFAQNLGQKYGVSVEKAASVLSAFSPRTDWEVNKDTAARFLASGGTMEANGATLPENFDRARLVYQSDTPLEMFKALKTGNFANNILDPASPDFSTHDSHDFDAQLGWATRIKKPGIFDQSGPRRANYQALQQSTATVADLTGYLPNEVQAAVWGPVRELKDANRGVQVVWNDAIRAILQGRGDPPLSDLAGRPQAPLTTFDPPVTQGKNPGLVVSFHPDDTVSAWGPSTAGVSDSLRTLRPALAEDQPVVVPYLPVFARRVQDALEYGRQLVQSTPGGVPAFASQSLHVEDPSLHPAMVPGNHLWVEAPGTDPTPLIGLAGVLHQAGVPVDQARLTRPFQRTEPTASTVRLQASRVLAMSPAEFAGPESPLVTHQWAAMSAFRSPEQAGVEGKALDRLNEKAHTQMGAALRKAGYDPVETVGNYGASPEKSWLTFGMPNSEAVAMGRQFGQDAVATSSGLYFTNGTHLPATGEPPAFNKLRQDYAEITLASGKKVRFQAQYGNEAPTPENIDEPLQPSAQSRVALMVPLGDSPTPELIKQAWDEVAQQSTAGAPLRRAMYLHGGLLAPDDTSKLYDFVHVDDAGRTLVHRSATAEATAPNAVPVYVPTPEGAQYRPADNPLLVDQRTKETPSSAVEQGDRVMVNGELQILTANLPDKLTYYRPNPVASLVDGVRPRYAVISVTGDALPTMAFGMKDPAEAVAALGGADPRTTAVVHISGPAKRPDVQVTAADTGIAVEAVRLLRRAGVPIADVRRAIQLPGAQENV